MRRLKDLRDLGFCISRNQLDSSTKCGAGFPRGLRPFGVLVRGQSGARLLLKRLREVLRRILSTGDERRGRKSRPRKARSGRISLLPWQPHGVLPTICAARQTASSSPIRTRRTTSVRSLHPTPARCLRRRMPPPAARTPPTRQAEGAACPRGDRRSPREVLRAAAALPAMCRWLFAVRSPPEWSAPGR